MLHGSQVHTNTLTFFFAPLRLCVKQKVLLEILPISLQIRHKFEWGVQYQSRYAALMLLGCLVCLKGAVYTLSFRFIAHTNKIKMSRLITVMSHKLAERARGISRLAGSWSITLCT